LLQGIVERARRHVYIWLPGYDTSSRFYTMAELAMAAPLARLVPTIFFEDLDQLLDLHSDSDLQVACRITFGLTGAATALARLFRRRPYRCPLGPIVMLHG